LIKFHSRIERRRRRRRKNGEGQERGRQRPISAHPMFPSVPRLDSSDQSQVAQVGRPVRLQVPQDKVEPTASNRPGNRRKRLKNDTDRRKTTGIKHSRFHWDKCISSSQILL
jgi:hypothetical protein